MTQKICRPPFVISSEVKETLPIDARNSGSYDYSVKPPKIGETLNCTCSYRIRQWDTVSKRSDIFIIFVDGELHLI